MTFKALSLAGFAGVAIYSVPVAAHHSFAMFDAAKTMMLEGTVKEFLWTNPHSWIHINVTEAGGKMVQWSVEMGAPSGLVRQGWLPKTLTPGMPIKLIIHPLRSGDPGGQFMQVTLADGRQLGDPSTRGTAPPQANPSP
jgi:hypothetical protein